jgi:hypothetical protein
LVELLDRSNIGSIDNKIEERKLSKDKARGKKRGSFYKVA